MKPYVLRGNTYGFVRQKVRFGKAKPYLSDFAPDA